MTVTVILIGIQTNEEKKMQIQATKLFRAGPIKKTWAQMPL